jgi:hypothetical protein
MAYSQNDSRWKSVLLGFGTGTIGQYGCFVTAYANLLTYYGHNTTPLQMNDIMKERKWFTGTSKNLVANHQVPQTLYPSEIKWVEDKQWPNPVDWNYFNDANDINILYIIKLDSSPAAGVQDHFVLVQGKKGNDLLIDDPWDGKRKMLSAYGDPAKILYASYKYTRVKQPPQEIEMEPYNGGDNKNVSDVTGIPQDQLNKPSWNKVFYDVLQPLILKLRGDNTELNKRPTQTQLDALREEYLKATSQVEELSKRPTQQAMDAAINNLQAQLNIERSKAADDSNRSIWDLLVALANKIIPFLKNKK